MRSYAVQPDNYDALSDLTTVAEAFHGTRTFHEARSRPAARPRRGLRHFQPGEQGRVVVAVAGGAVMQ
jgi:hypothetical protein